MDSAAPALFDPGAVGRLYPERPAHQIFHPAALDFPRAAERAFENLRRAGMHVVRTSDSLDSAMAS